MNFKPIRGRLSCGNIAFSGFKLTPNRISFRFHLGFKIIKNLNIIREHFVAGCEPIIAFFYVCIQHVYIVAILNVMRHQL